MSEEVSLFKKTWFLVLNGIIIIVSLTGGILEASYWYLQYEEKHEQQQKKVLEDQVENLVKQRFSTMQMQPLQTEIPQRYDAQEAQRAEAQRLREYNVQQALLQAQQVEAKRVAEEKLQAEAQQLIDYNTQQALLKMQAQFDEMSEKKSEGYDESKTALSDTEPQKAQLEAAQSKALETVQSYFENVNRHQIQQAMNLLEQSTNKTRKILENNEWIKVHELNLVSIDSSEAIINVHFTGKAKSAQAQEYVGMIPLHWINYEWKIATLSKLKPVE